jgi:hypothetical protein
MSSLNFKTEHRFSILLVTTWIFCFILNPIVSFLFLVLGIKLRESLCTNQAIYSWPPAQIPYSLIFSPWCQQLSSNISNKGTRNFYLQDFEFHCWELEVTDKSSVKESFTFHKTHFVYSIKNESEEMLEAGGNHKKYFRVVVSRPWWSKIHKVIRKSIKHNQFITPNFEVEFCGMEFGVWSNK